MHGLKNAILAISQKSAEWLDWTCPVSAALQNGSQDFFSLLYLIFSFIFLNMKPLSKVAPGLLFIQIQIQAVCRSKQSYYCTTIRPFEMHCRSFLIFQLKGFKKHNIIIKFIKALQKHFIIVLCFLKPFKAC